MYNNKHHTFEYQYNHRFGFHVNGWSKQVVDTCLVLKPPVVKVIDPNVDTLRRIKENRPDTLIIYRRYLPDQYLGSTMDEAYNVGRAKADIMLRTEAVQAGLVDLVESYNERLPEVASDWEHALYSRFMVGFYDQCEKAGFPAEPIAFNFATGNGSAELFMRSYLEPLTKYRWLGFHEYDWPWLHRLHSEGLKEGNGGKWLALRYQRILDPIVEQMGDRWSVVITEAGMTQGVLGGHDVGPWAETNTVDVAPWHDIKCPISPNEYWQSLLWYNDRIMKDPRVAGVCLFVTGASGGWDTFEHIPDITDLIAAHQETVDSIPSQPPATRGLLKTQIYIQQAPGEFVGLEADLQEGQQVTVRASGDTASDRIFSHYTDHRKNDYFTPILSLDAGTSLSLTVHFKDKEPEPVNGQPTWWPYKRPLVGLHGRNDYDWRIADRSLVKEAKIECVSFMGHTHIGSFAAFQSQFPNVPIITRIHNPELQNEYFNQGRRPEPSEYVERVRGAIAAQGPYSQIFRIHNEPNHRDGYEGWGSSRQNAQEFNLWFISVIGQLRKKFPRFRFLFPNLAQGDDTHNDLVWFENCLPAIKAADGWAASCYWQNFAADGRNHLSEDWGTRFARYHRIASDAGILRPIFLAEVGNSNHHGGQAATEEQVARELVEYYQHIIANYPEVYAVMPFLLSSPGDWQEFAWREENGRFKPVVYAVGGMDRPPL